MMQVWRIVPLLLFFLYETYTAITRLMVNANTTSASNYFQTIDANGPYVVGIQMPNSFASVQAYTYYFNATTSTAPSYSIEIADHDPNKKIRAFNTNSANGVNSYYLHFNTSKMFLFYQFTNQISFFNVSSANDLIK